QFCFADEVKKETNAIDELQATIEARLTEIKNFVNEHVDQAKIKEIAEKIAEHGKKFVTDTTSDIEALNKKST
ncbi:hypothetical protein KR222_002622, partial [Zaprionus bogoriensis]